MPSSHHTPSLTATMKTLLLTFTFATLLAIPTLAQDAQLAPDEVRWTLATVQVKVSLKNDQEAVKTQTLKNAIVLATLFRDKVDLSCTVRAISDVYENTTSASHRLLALAALQAIATRRAQDYVARNTTTEQSDEGRLVVASVLNDYYLAQKAPIKLAS